MSIDACAALVRTADPDRFASAMCARNLSQRADLMVIYAFNVEVARAPWVTQEEMIAEMRLQWWKDAIAEIYEDNTVRRHEVVTPLSEVVARNQLPRALFDELIEARRFDIYREGHASQEAFETYIASTSANVMKAAGLALAARDLDSFALYGRATGLANLFKALPELYARGRDPIPAGSIDRNAAIEGRADPALAETIATLARSGITSLKEARTQRGGVSNDARPALLAGWMAEHTLKAVLSDPERALRGELQMSPVRRSLSLAWKNLTGLW